MRIRVVFFLEYTDFCEMYKIQMQSLKCLKKFEHGFGAILFLTYPEATG